MNPKSLLPILLVLAYPALAQSAPQANTQALRATKSHSTTQTSQQPIGEGSRIFQQNCSRCHNTPEGFSPGISGTVAQHMRVRASLSKHDEEELLRFLNP
jgi:mono/diheme cytochrome c family protein